MFLIQIFLCRQFNSTGVYTEANCGTNILGYHAITVVGYGTLSSTDYWVSISRQFYNKLVIFWR